MPARKCYDVTLPLCERMLSYPNDPPFKKKAYKSVDKGNSVNVSEYSFGSHAGTHLDIPKHCFKTGKSLDAYPLERFLGKVQVISIPQDVMIIMPEHLTKKMPLKARKVFFKTRNSSGKYIGASKFRKDYASLGIEAARVLKKEGVSMAGIDYLSIEAYGSKPHSVHEFLLRNDILIVEALDLRLVPEGVYDLICLPLRVAGADGGLLRVLLKPL